jgi:2-polyprenyl-3-methyl-5-hydroxy-6-metoxy-1,4-benzoquinol methylase
MRESGQPAGRGSGERIDQSYYEGSGYFTGGGSHLLSPVSRFHRYRIREVLRGCGEIRGKKVLDLGCGWGTISFALAGAGAREVLGVDFAANAIEICEARLRAEPHPNLAFRQGDAGNTGLAGAEWDLVVAADLVEHLYPEDTLRVYREVFRLLRPRGHFLIWTPNPGHFLEQLRFAGILRADPTHVDYKTLDRCRDELRATGFRIQASEYRPSHLPALRQVEGATQSFLPLLRRRVLVLAERP